MIRTLITETYGGKIDNEADFARLTALVAHFLVPAAYESDHQLIAGLSIDHVDNDIDDRLATDEGLPVPSGTALSDFTSWVKRLPEREPPTYLGLPANAEKLLLVGDARAMIENLYLVTKLLEEGEQIMAEASVVDTPGNGTA